MTEEVQAPEAGEVVETLPQEEVIEQAPEVNSESVDEARKYGWRPKEEFDLAPESWVDADRFLELPSTQRKQLNDTNKSLTAKIETLERSTETSMREAARAAKLALDHQQRLHEKELESIRASQRRAAEEGDMATYDQLEKKGQELSQATPTEGGSQAPQPRTAEFQQHMQTSAWTKDAKLLNAGRVAIDSAPEIIKATWATDLDQLLYAEAELKKHFPESFEQPKPRLQKVDAGGIGRQKVSKGVNALPPEARQAAKEFVEQGVFGSVEEYAKVYFEGDE